MKGPRLRVESHEVVIIMAASGIRMASGYVTAGHGACASRYIVLRAAQLSDRTFSQHTDLT